MTRLLAPALVLLVLAVPGWVEAGPRDARARALKKRALAYLDPSVRPRPAVLSGSVPDFELFTYRDRRCWGLRDGLVCSACYDHPKRYLGQLTVLCPWNRALCRYTESADEERRLGVDYNQCVRKD